MKLTTLFLEQLENEAALNKRVLERVPEGRNDWKPHAKSMPLGYLAALVASMPSWIEMMISSDEFDITDETSAYKTREVNRTSELLALLEQSVNEARAALQNTTDEHLQKSWKLMAHGFLASESPRYVMLRDAVFSHLAHHRGQLTVYLRLNEARVPALYGPSADEGF